MKTFALLLLAALAAVCAPATADAPAPLAAIPLTPYLVKLATVHVSVAGHEGTFLFDTGEGVSSITPEFAAKIGCKPWGQITGFQMSGNRLDSPRCDNVTFDASGRHFNAPSVGVGDINRFLPPGAQRLDGSLGLDIFAGQAITLEPQKQLVVESAHSLAARVKNAHEIKIRLVRDAEGLALNAAAAVETPQGQAWMELDTGNTGTLIVGNHIAPLVGLQPDLSTPTPVHMTLTGGVPVDAPARTRDIIMDGNLGTPFLKNWNLTLDLAHSRAWLSPIAQ